jgi:hypothetical protein
VGCGAWVGGVRFCEGTVEGVCGVESSDGATVEGVVAGVVADEEEEVEERCECPGNASATAADSTPPASSPPTAR